MVMIVAHHFSIHGGFDFPTEQITVNRLWIQFIQIGGKIGIDIFILISGYFLIKSEFFKTSKVLKLWIQIFTYSILIFVILVVLRIEPFSIIKLIYVCFPITFSQWWFASTYFMLFMLSPFINKLLVSMDKKMYLRFLLLLFTCWCLMPTFTGQAFQISSLSWFVFLYSLAGYIRLYCTEIKAKGVLYIIAAFIVTMLTWISAVIFDILGIRIPIFAAHSTFFYSMEKLPILIISVLMLVGFLNIQIKYSKIINIISSATFGVYLIHENEYIRPFLWENLFKNSTFSKSKMLIPYSILVVVIVYICCTIIELARIYLLEKRHTKKIELISKKIDFKIEKIFNKKERCI